MPRGGERSRLCDQKRVNKSLDQLQGQKGSIPGKQTNMARKKTGPQNKGLCEFKTKFQSFTKSTIDEGTEKDFICGERTLFRVKSHIEIISPH